MNSTTKAIPNFLRITAIQSILLFSVACNQKNETATNSIDSTPSNTVVKTSDSTVVFSRIRQGEVTINNEYCENADEATRAILFYYANKFSTGFDTQNNSLLTMALQSKKSQGKIFNGKELIEKWFQGSDRIKLDDANVSAVLPDGASNSTWFTLISVVKDKDIRRVYFRTLDTGDEEKYKKATDIFQVSGDHIKVIKVHDFAE